MEIQEIPLDNQEETEKEEIKEEKPTGPEERNISLSSEPAPKKRGRPAGSRNRNPKPKADPPPSPPPPKKKKKIPVVEESEEEEEETPAYDRRAMNGLPPNPGIDRRALASEMLNILQQQHYGKSQIRRNHYASWFQNGI